VRILLFTLLLSVLVTLAFSAAPGVCSSWRPRLAEALRQKPRGTASKASQRFRKIAVGLQISLTVVLLGGAGLVSANAEQSAESERRLRDCASGELRCRPLPLAGLRLTIALRRWRPAVVDAVARDSGRSNKRLLLPIPRCPGMQTQSNYTVQGSCGT